MSPSALHFATSVTVAPCTSALSDFLQWLNLESGGKRTCLSFFVLFDISRIKLYARNQV